MPSDAAKLSSPPAHKGRRGQIFAAGDLPPARPAAQFEALRTAYPDLLPDTDAAAQYLRRIHVPASMRWAFLNNGKAGTSSARRLLFQLEFGVPLTVAWDVADDINSDAVAHRLQGPSGILRQAAQIANPVARLGTALRLTTVRHPVTRALSAFDYLCRSHELRHVWFVQERLRMNALVGFDWDRHPRTADGLARFLDYIHQHAAISGPQALDPHWRPQVENILPRIFLPDLVGRLEDLPAFFAAVAERLDQPLPDDASLPRSNRQERRSDRAALLTAANRAAIARIYAADFEWLGYQPDEPA